VATGASSRSAPPEPSNATDEATAYKPQPPLTQEGTILGTFQYMAPEQLEGQEADARTDIFAFGAMLYEMATGKRAFEGKTKTSLIAAIVKDQPRPISELQPLTPRAFEHVVAKCLSKDPDERWQSAHDVAEELRWISETGMRVDAATSASRSRRWFYPALAALLGLTTLVATAMILQEQRPRQRQLVVSIAPPRGHYFNAIGNTAGAAVISPDGRSIAFSAAARDRVATLWIYSLESGEAKQLSSTEGAKFQFWSPDSKSLAFFADAKLKRIDIAGGEPTILCDAPNARGGAWGSGGTILFTPSTTTPIFRISASGGSPVQVTRLDPDVHTTHRWPEFLPDGRHFIYLAASHQKAISAANGIFLGSLDGKASRRLVNTSASGIHVSGNLFYARDNILYAQKLSGDFAPEGEPGTVTGGVVIDGAIWRSAISAASDGTLLFHSGASVPRSELTWFDRTGKLLGTIGSADVYLDCRLSPDGRKLLIGIGDPVRHLWMHDLQRDVRSRFSVSSDWSGSPAWSRDGSTVYYVALQPGGWRVLSASAAGGKVPRALVNLGDASARVTDVSPDGKWVVCDMDDNAVLVPTSGGTPQRLLPTNLTSTASFSPDGKWIAYTSNEHGNRAEIFIASSEDRSAKWQVSTSGGNQPQWRADGKELFYLTASDGTLMAVPIDASGNELQVGRPQELFSALFKTGFTDRPYTVAPDGQRILVNLARSDDAPGLTLVSDWKKLALRQAQQ